MSSYHYPKNVSTNLIFVLTTGFDGKGILFKHLDIFFIFIKISKSGSLSC